MGRPAKDGVKGQKVSLYISGKAAAALAKLGGTAVEGLKVLISGHLAGLESVPDSIPHNSRIGFIPHNSAADSLPHNDSISHNESGPETTVDRSFDEPLM